MTRSRRLISTCGIGVLFVGLIGCEGAHRIKVETAYGPGVRIGGRGYTYDWAKEVPATGDVHIANPQVHERVRSLVEENLAAKGYVKATDRTPDAWLDYGLKREMRRTLRRHRLPPIRQGLDRALHHQSRNQPVDVAGLGASQDGRGGHPGRTRVTAERSRQRHARGHSVRPCEVEGWRSGKMLRADAPS